MKPVIGITIECERHPEDLRTGGSMHLNWNYAQRIVEAGGIPVLIPPMADAKDIAGLIDGLLITGGNDIDAAHFGEPNHPAVELQDPARFDCESALVGVLDKNVPVLGICYGCQFLNVSRGGSLIQHVPDVVGSTEHSGGTLQTYPLESDSKLRDITGEGQVAGKSYHHQAIGTVGRDLRVVARAEDGIVEAIEATDQPWVIGVQWHPERTPDDETSKRIFERFIAAAKGYAKKRQA